MNVEFSPSGHGTLTSWDTPEAHFDSFVDKFQRQGHRLAEAGSRSIHSERSLHFMSHVIHADPEVLDILKNGLKLQLIREPQPFETKNNRSAENHMGLLRLQVQEWEVNGFLKRCSHKPCYVNPMSVIVQVNSSTGATKYRPVIDMSRVVNKLVKYEKTKLDDLTVIEPMLMQDDFMTSFDLENMYFHVRLHPDSVKYFGFGLPDEFGNMVYYQFLVMCYGFRSAVEVVTRLTKLVKAWLHEQGIRTSIYLDDNLTLAENATECKWKFELVLHVFQLAGWVIQWSKTTTEPTQQLQYLGFIIDTVHMKYWASEAKLTRLEDMLMDFLLDICFEHPVPALKVAAILGNISSIGRSHGPLVRILSRASQHQLGKQVLAADWSSMFC